MAANEKEEFEFRLRAEKEAGVKASPKGGLDTGQDTSSKAAFLASGAKPVKEEKPPMITPMDVMGGPLGVVSAAGKRAIGNAYDFLNQDFNVPGLGRDNPMRLLQGMGPLSAGGAAGEMGVASPVVRNAAKEKAAVSAIPKPAGAGAEAAVNELQRQRGVMDAGKVGPSTAKASPVEDAMASVQGATGQFQEVLHNTHGEFDVSGALKDIDRQLGGTAIEASERAALQKVKQTIEQAVTNAGGATPTIQTAKGPMMVKNGKLVPAETKGGLPIEYLDNVRQAINKEINAKDASGKPLSKDTQRRLYDVQNALLKDAPEAYRKAIRNLSDAKSKLDEFTAAGGARTKVTGDAAAFHLLNDADKQSMIQSAFKSDTPGRALSELVRDTKHNPEALQGVRSSYIKWLTDEGDASASKLTGNWKRTREAVKSSGLMTADHIANIDKSMADIKMAEESGSGGFKKAWASTAGFFAGLMVGHPMVGAHLARDTMSGATKSQKVNEAMNNAMMTIAADPAGASALAAKPTPANVQKVLKLLPTDVAAQLTPLLSAPKQDNKPAKRDGAIWDVLTNQPAGM